MVAQKPDVKGLLQFPKRRLLDKDPCLRKVLSANNSFISARLATQGVLGLEVHRTTGSGGRKLAN